MSCARSALRATNGVGRIPSRPIVVICSTSRAKSSVSVSASRAWLGGSDGRATGMPMIGVSVADTFSSFGWNRFHARRASVANSNRCHGRFAISRFTNGPTSAGTSGGSAGSGMGAFLCCSHSSSFVPSYGSRFVSIANRMHPSA